MGQFNENMKKPRYVYSAKFQGMHIAPTMLNPTWKERNAVLLWAELLCLILEALLEGSDYNLLEKSGHDVETTNKDWLSS